MSPGRISSGTLERAHRRLQHLYEISKLLTSFDSVDTTVPAVVDLITRTLPLRSAIFILEAEDRPRTIVWQARGESSTRLREARAHARRSYAYLAGPAAARAALDGRTAGRDDIGEEAGDAARPNLVLLPLAIAGRPIFGALQLEGAARLDELDLVFINSVVNQLAVALDRQTAIAAREAATESRRIAAEAGRARAERGEAAAQEAEQRARDQLDFARAVTGSMGEGVVAVDVDCRVTLLNPAAARMLGWREEEAIGRPVQDVIQIERANGAPLTDQESPFKVAMGGRDSIQSEDALFSGRGRSDFSVAYTAAALRDGGALSGAVLAFQDVTSRKQAEEATAQLAAIVTSSDDAIFSKDAEGIIRTWNDGATRHFGYTAEEAIGRPVDLLMPPDRADEGFEVLERVRGETLVQHETERRRKDGSLLAVSLTVSPIRDAAGRVIGASIIARDITYRREAERAQKRAETEQRLLVEVATIVASSLDRRAALSAVARCVVPGFADLCTIDEVGEDGLSRRLEVVFADPDKQRDLADRIRRFTPRRGWKTPQARVLQSGNSIFLPEITDPATDGVAQDKKHAEAMRDAGVRSMMALPLNARGKVLGVLTFVVGDSGRRFSPQDFALAEEIARRVAAGLDNAWLYEQAQRAIRAREELLAIVSHDLKNPLAVILMSTALMDTPPGVDERRRSRRQIETIKRSAARMNRLIQDLLDTARIEAGKLSVERRRVEVAPLVRETIEAMQSLAASKSLQLTSHLPHDLPEVAGDASRLQQVFANLVGNAIKFTPDGGSITIRAKVAGDEILFSITDTGSGIPKNELPYLFDRFWQARRTARKGTGLGLSIVKGIVAAHGGRMWVKSQLRVGSAFFFTLPAAQRDVDEPAEPGNGLEANGADTLREEVARHSAEIQDLADEARRREVHTALESTRIARELATVIDSLLQYALIESGRLSTQAWTFDVREIAVDVIAKLRPYAEEKGLELRLMAPARITRVTSDPVLTRLILLNLVGNAIEFTEAGKVEIAIEGVERGCTIAVRDSGPGISAEEQARIFEPFTRRDLPEQHATGMGMRLTLVREVAAALGGHVDLESEIGRGSTFTVALPCLLQPSDQQHPRLH